MTDRTPRARNSTQLGLPGMQLPRGRQLLDDLDRLPLPAAADMWALRVGGENKIVPSTQRQLERLLQRLSETDDDDDVAAIGCSVLRTLAAVGPHGGLGAQAGAAAVALVELVVLRKPREIGLVAQLVLAGTDQFSAAVATALVRLARDEERRADLAAVTGAWLADAAPPWKESAPATGRDVVVGAVVLQLAEKDDMDGAIAVAQRWPPTRTPLVAFTRLLLAAPRVDAVVVLAARLQTGGLLWRAMAEVADEAVAAASQALDHADRHALAELFGLRLDEDPAPQPHETAAPLELAAEALRSGDDPGLVERLLQAGASADELAQLALRHPGRGRFLKATMRALERDDPLAAFTVRAGWLMLACRAWPSLAAAGGMRRAIVHLRSLASSLGEPALADQVIEALRHNHDEPAMLALLR